FGESVYLSVVCDHGGTLLIVLRAQLPQPPDPCRLVGLPLAFGLLVLFPCRGHVPLTTLLRAGQQTLPPREPRHLRQEPLLLGLWLRRLHVKGRPKGVSARVRRVGLQGSEVNRVIAGECIGEDALEVQELALKRAVLRLCCRRTLTDVLLLGPL